MSLRRLRDASELSLSMLDFLPGLLTLLLMRQAQAGNSLGGREMGNSQPCYNTTRPSRAQRGHVHTIARAILFILRLVHHKRRYGFASLAVERSLKYSAAADSTSSHLT